VQALVLGDGAHFEKVDARQVFVHWESEGTISSPAGSIAGGVWHPGGVVLLQLEDEGPHVAGVEAADDGRDGVGLGWEDMGGF